MDIKDIIEKPGIQANDLLIKRYSLFKVMISELRKKSIPDEVVLSINQLIDEVNSFVGTDKALAKLLKRNQISIVKLVEKKLKIVPKNYYRTLWLALGMAVFGVPFGVAFGISLNNMAFMGIGIPLGMAIGMGVGAGMDRKAAEEGRQLDFESEF